METESVVTVGGRRPHGETGAVGDLVTDARSWAVKDAFAEKREVRATEAHALEELGSGESSPWLSTQSESASATDYFTAWGRPDDNRTGEAMASLATERRRLVGLFTTASMVAAINSIVAGAGVVLAGVLLTGENLLRRTLLGHRQGGGGGAWRRPPRHDPRVQQRLPQRFVTEEGSIHRARTRPVAMTVTALATATGKNATQTAAAPSSKTEGFSLSPALAGSLSGEISKKPLAAAADTIEHNPIDTDRWCSVPRNDIHELALQPTPNQVEWAVDMAIRGNLHSGYLTQGGWRSQTGITTIDPQGMFPVPTLNGGGRIPAQVELGILAQESNLWQAESGAIPGQMGNPLAAMAGFYGHKGDTPSAYWKIDWAHSDCGYGVGQVTDGMRLAGHEKTNETSLSPEKQKAVALDYATNIAASLNILADKWNEVHTDGQTVSVNNDDASKPENWFSAMWNYNLGFNKVSDASKNGGHWGLGWYNNPANPVYPPGRLAFMDTDLDHNANQDAAHPQNWPYEEKVMGWSAWSIDTGHSYATTGPAIPGSPPPVSVPPGGTPPAPAPRSSRPWTRSATPTTTATRPIRRSATTRTATSSTGGTSPTPPGRTTAPTPAVMKASSTQR
ncbi:hypothetical protein [Streptomyces mirabilis]|uniref:hypothetical protein n=1 Tax=Streptomyces mirabilis TaxID=68239 RepID=UPI0036E4B3F0